MRLRPDRTWNRRVARSAVAAAGITGVIAAAAVADVGGFFGYLVGQTTPNGVVLPTNQTVTPVGSRAYLTDGRILASSLSPDGSKVAALSWNNFTGFLTILDLAGHRAVAQVGTGSSSDPQLGDGSVGADGPLYSADGRTLWVPQATDIVRFAVAADGTVNSPVVIKLPSSKGGALPSGMALAPDGRKLYVALNGNNTLGVLDTTTNALLKQVPVGNAPRQVAIVAGQAFVSNEGGRPAVPGDFTNLSFGTPIVADPHTAAATTGTLSVVDLASESQTSTIPVGLQPTSLYLAGETLLVANSNDDSVSIVDTATRAVTQTFNVNPLPGSTVGSAPNAITMPDPQHILVSLGRDNALAVYGYDGPRAPVRYQGLLPTDFYPVNVQMTKALGGAVVVTNDKGIGARGPASTVEEGPGTAPATGHNTYDDTGTVTTFSPTATQNLAALTHQVFVNNDWVHLLSAQPTPPPSPIKHVFLIVKENRTYDQILGDTAKGNNDASLAQFGAKVTPNAHALTNGFVQFDNFYDPGTLSADGHNWLTQAGPNDYIEKEFGAFYRSYPASGADALAYQRNGFLWDAAARAGKTASAFGEYANFFTGPGLGAPGPTPPWRAWYRDSQIMEGRATGPLPVDPNAYSAATDIPSLRAILDPRYPVFNLGIPDQYRVDIWEQAFKKAEAANNLANLTTMWLPNDHTSGVNGGNPYPTAQVADNDLALGRIISDISHSRDWKTTAVFVVEDDPQNGVDHVDGHRSVLYLASPYARRGALDSRYYTQVNVVKTIETILGIPPMNQMDRAAVPITEAFTTTPNNTPYTVRPNQIPLDLGLPPATTPGLAAAAKPMAAARAAAARPVIPPTMAGIFRRWVKWSARQHFTGPVASQDAANPAQLNRVDWYAATGWVRPYPGDRRILPPSQVPGRNRPAGELARG